MDIYFTINSDVRFRNVAGEGVILRQNSGEVLVVNQVGVRVLELIMEGNSYVSILNKLVDEFDVQHVILEADIDAYIHELKMAEVLHE